MEGVFNSSSMASSASPYSSPASSSVSLPFPSTSTQIKGSSGSNPHPYMSTGVLTRPSSTHSTHSTHPSSPTKSKVKQACHSEGHKCTRSSNEELPRPLPFPPNFPSSGSPTKTEFEPHDSFIMHREWPSDSRHSLSQPNLLIGSVTDELPDDPRVWTPSQLSMYLTSSLRVISGDSPPSFAQDIATFIHLQKMTGQRFLRLTEGDLHKYEINQHWRSALLGASRNLRQGSLRGQILDQDGEQEGDNHESFSSNSSTSSAAELHRGRPENSSGRVQGMIAPFEHNGPSRTVLSIKGSSNLSSVKQVNHGPGSDSVIPQSDIFMTTATIETSPAIIPPTIISTDPDHQKEPRLLPLPPPSAIMFLEHSTFGASPPPAQRVRQGSGIPAFGPYTSSQDLSLPPSSISPHTTSAAITSHNDFSDHIDQARQLEPRIAFTPAHQSQPFDALCMNTLAEGVRPLPLPPHPNQFYQPLALPAMLIPQSNYTSVRTSVDGGDGVIIGVPELADQVQVPYVLSESTEGAITVPHVQVLQHVPESTRSLNAQAPNVGVQHNLHNQQPHLHQLDSVFSHSPYQISSQLQPQGQEHHHQLSHSGSILRQILAPQPRYGGRELSMNILEEKLEELLEPRPRSRVFQSQPISQPRSRVPSSSKKKESLSLSGTSDTQGRSRSRIANDKSVGLSVKEKPPIVGSGGIGEVAAGAEENMGAGSDSLDIPNTTSPRQYHHHPRTRVISVSSQIHSHRLSGVEAWGENHRHVVVPPSSSPSSFENVLDSSTLSIVESQGVKELEGEEETGIEALLEKEVTTLSIPVPVHISDHMPASDVGTGGMDTGHMKESGTGNVGSDGTESLAHSQSGSLREPKSAVITLIESIPSSQVNMPHEEGETVGGMGERIEALLAKIDSPSSSSLGSASIVRKTKKRTPLSDIDAWEMADAGMVQYVDGDDHDKSIGDTCPSERPGSPSNCTAPHSQKPLRVLPSASLVPLLSRKEPDNTNPKLESIRLTSGPYSSSDMPAKAKLDELERKEKELAKNVDETRNMMKEAQRRLESLEQWIAEKESESRRKAKEATAKRKEQEEKGYVWSAKRSLNSFRDMGMLGFSAWFGVSSPISSSPSISASSLKTQSQTTLIRRIAKLRLKLSMYVALFGIGIGVVVLKTLGKGPKFGGIGAKFTELTFR